jgi:hypothetical protein
MHKFGKIAPQMQHKEPILHPLRARSDDNRLGTNEIHRGRKY